MRKNDERRGVGSKEMGAMRRQEAARGQVNSAAPMTNHDWEIVVFDSSGCCLRHELQGDCVALGRQRKGEPRPYAVLSPDDQGDASAPERVIIAPLSDETVSRSQIRIQLGIGEMTVANTSRNVEFRVGDQILAPGEETRVDAGTSIWLGRWRIVLQSPHTTDAFPFGTEDVYETCDQNTIVPGRRTLSADLRGLFESRVTRQNYDVFLPVLDAVMEVLQSTAGGPGFEKQAVATMLEQSRFERVAVLRRDESSDDWQVVAQLPSGGSRAWFPSRRVLEMVLREGCPIRNRPAESEGGSLAGIVSFIAAPIFSADGQVRGVLYADQLTGVEPARTSDFEPLLARILASGIASGWERLRAQHQADHVRSLFEQFFSQKLAKSLDQDPDLLRGRREEISLLFCDIRGFSRISEQIGPATTMEWMGSVMTDLAEAVLTHDGVLVDFIGDELMAMWGAPVRQEDHAEAACRAALDMTKRLEKLNQQWASTLPGPFDVGIGIHSGEAFVGNTGSQQKFKYGPLGHTVNLASRLQSATKLFGTRILVTDATVAHLPDTMPRRRLTQVRVVGIESPVTLFELRHDDSPEKRQWCCQYELALELFEKGELAAAVDRLGDVLGDAPQDIPALLLMNRVTQALFDRESKPSAVWTLPTK